MPSTAREARSLTRLALPIIATNIGTMMLGVVDTLMLGRFSKEALAAATLGNAWLSGTSLFLMGLIFGMDPIVTQAHGARDGERAGLCLQRGIVVALAASFLLVAAWACTEPFLLWTGQDAALAHTAHRYVLVQAPAAWPFMVYTAMRQYLQGRGILRPALWVTLLANLLNGVLNWILIFGALGAPALGAEGAGIASALTRGFLFFGLFYAFRKLDLHRGAWVPWSRRAVSLSGLLEILRYGLPIAFQLVLEMGAFAVALLMAGRIDTTAVAAHAIVINMASLTFMVPFGVSMGAVTHVGNLIGAGDPARAQRASSVAFAMGAGTMALAAAAFLLLREELPRLYSGEIEVVLACAAILPIAAAFQVFDGLQVVGGGILRAMGKPLPAALFNLVGYWVLALPLAWWLAFTRGMGLAGIWWGLAVGLAIIALSLVAWVRARGPASLGRASAGLRPTPS